MADYAITGCQVSARPSLPFFMEDGPREDDEPPAQACGGEAVNEQSGQKSTSDNARIAIVSTPVRRDGLQAVHTTCRIRHTPDIINPPAGSLHSGVESGRQTAIREMHQACFHCTFPTACSTSACTIAAQTHASCSMRHCSSRSIPSTSVSRQIAYDSVDKKQRHWLMVIIGHRQAV